MKNKTKFKPAFQFSVTLSEEVRELFTTHPILSTMNFSSVLRHCLAEWLEKNFGIVISVVGKRSLKGRPKKFDGTQTQAR